jgi:hypothetical protein
MSAFLTRELPSELPAGLSAFRQTSACMGRFREIGWGGMDWIDLAQDRDQWTALVNTVMKLSILLPCWHLTLIVCHYNYVYI